MADIVGKIRTELEKLADKVVRESGERFFKEPIRLYGMKTAVVEKIAKARFAEIRSEGKEKIFALCDSLWRSGYLEESLIACTWAYALRKEYEPADFAVFEAWVNTYVSNWAACDTLCNHTVGAFLEKFPDYLPRLAGWAKSENRWAKRASAVSLIVPARRGVFLGKIFAIADLLLEDEDDLVRKGYGWMLKAAAQAHMKEVFEYVMKNKERMPRTALRYAIEKMPKDLKAQAMAK